MDFPVFLNKFVIGFKPIQHTPFWFWFRLINHDNWRLDDNIRYWDFWNSINQGILDMNYVYKFEEFWGKGSYPPKKITLSAKDFDALVERLNEPPKYDEDVARLLTRKSPWDDNDE